MKLGSYAALSVRLEKPRSVDIFWWGIDDIFRDVIVRIPPASEPYHHRLSLRAVQVPHLLRCEHAGVVLLEIEYIVAPLSLKIPLRVIYDFM
jgi:hypothetical protein